MKCSICKWEIPSTEPTHIPHHYKLIKGSLVYQVPYLIGTNESFCKSCYYKIKAGDIPIDTIKESIVEDLK